MLACAARYETGAPRPRVAWTSEPFNHHHSCCACDRPFGGGGWIRVLSPRRCNRTPGDRPGGQRSFAFADQHPVLLLGSDDDSKFSPDHVLTQSMILLRVIPATKEVTMLSIPRDLYVHLST